MKLAPTLVLIACLAFTLLEFSLFFVFARWVQPQESPKWPLWAWGAAAVITFTLCFAFAGYTCALKVLGARTTGSVVEMRTHMPQDTDSPMTYSPVFTFTTSDGSSRRIDGNRASSAPTHKVGDTVQVLYFPNHPNRARIDEFKENWLAVLITGVSGVVSVFAALFKPMRYSAAQV